MRCMWGRALRRAFTFGLWVFEGGQLVYDHGVVWPVFAECLDEPRGVFVVDNRDVCVLVEGVEALFFGACCDCVGEVLEVVPFLYFLWPCVAGDTQGGDDECLFGGEVVVHEVFQGCECDDGFAESHVEEEGGFLVFVNELSCESLVVVWFVFHG